MFKSDSFPLGPNGSFPKQRINSFGNEIAAPQDAYLGNVHAKLSNQEHDFHGSNEAVKHRFKHGKHLGEKNVDKHRPRYAPKSKLSGYDDEDEGLGFFKMWRKRKKRMPEQSQSDEAHAKNVKRKEEHWRWWQRKHTTQPAMISSTEPRMKDTLYRGEPLTGNKMPSVRDEDRLMTHGMVPIDSYAKEPLRPKMISTQSPETVMPFNVSVQSQQATHHGPPTFAKAFGFRRKFGK